MTWPLQPTSSSAIDSYLVCPLQWSLRYGPHRVHVRGTSAARGHYDTNRRRGRVLHAALQAALKAAQRELATRTTPLTGATLRRYHATARAELNRAWETEKMPSDPAEAQFVVELFEKTLDAVTLPGPGAIYTVEQEIRHVTAGGVAVLFVPDYAYWSAPGVLRIVDWKSGKVDPAEVPRHRQLLRYAAWLAARDTRITGIEIELFAMRDGVGHAVPADPARVGHAAERFDRVAWTAAADSDPQPNIGSHCSGCSYRAVCPAMAKRLGGTHVA